MPYWKEINKASEIKRINKNLVDKDGNILSFDKQLIQLMSGVFDTSYPLVIAGDTKSLEYIKGIDTDLSLVMNATTVSKLREKHDLGYEFVSNTEKYLRESLFAFDSYQYETSRIVVLKEVDEDGFPMIAVCRQDKQAGKSLYINEITSIYEKQKLAKLIEVTYDKDLCFYKNEKIEHYLTSLGFQFAQGVKYALSDDYDKPTFTKSQVEEEMYAKGIDFHYADELEDEDDEEMEL